MNCLEVIDVKKLGGPCVEPPDERVYQGADGTADPERGAVVGLEFMVSKEAIASKTEWDTEQQRTKTKQQQMVRRRLQGTSQEKT